MLNSLASMLGRKKAKVTLREAFENHHKSGEHKEGTISEYRISIAHWERLTDDPDVSDISNVSLRQFRESLLTTTSPLTKRPYASNTVRKILTEIQAILATVGPPRHGKPDAVGLIVSAPVVKKPKWEEKTVTTVSDEEINAIYKACEVATWPATFTVKVSDRETRNLKLDPIDWWRALLVYMYNIGSRRNEWRELRWAQIDFERKRIKLDHAEKAGSKEWKPIPDILLVHLERIREPERELVFPMSRAIRKLYEQWYTIQHHAGIFLDVDTDKRQPYYWFHEVRATCGTNWSEHSIAAAQHMLGHKNIKTTMNHYVERGKVAEKVQDKMQQPSAFSADNPKPKGNVRKIPITSG